MEAWGTVMRFRAAHWPLGCGIVERVHRTVKCIATRKNCTVPEAVYLHNITPLDNVTDESAPGNILFNYKMRLRGLCESVKVEEACRDNPFATGDPVWVRPPNYRCDNRYDEGVVGDVLSPQVVEINGWPRHVRDLRRRIPVPVTPADKPPVAESSQEDEEVPLMVDFRTREELQPTPEQPSVVPEESREVRRSVENPVEEPGSPPSIHTTP